MKTLKFDEFSVNEAMNATMRKSLDELGKGLETDDDIVEAIEKAGFKKEKPTGREISAEYVFSDPSSDDDKRYVSYKNGLCKSYLDS